MDVHLPSERVEIEQSIKTFLDHDPDPKLTKIRGEIKVNGCLVFSVWFPPCAIEEPKLPWTTFLLSSKGFLKSKGNNQPLLENDGWDLDAIMSELETTDNFRSFVNGDGANDDGDYENDDNYQDDVGVQDEEEVDSEL
ncbi:hypothetical protein JHK87_031512 [Glycine soja]|nr:hypothetical protein JHK87_031512 [Glycine soja]